MKRPPYREAFITLNFLCYSKCSNCELLNKMLSRSKTIVCLHLFINLFFIDTQYLFISLMKQGFDSGLHLFPFSIQSLSKYEQINIKNNEAGVPTVAQWQQIELVPMRVRV